jgi:hypothetical protein
MNDPEYVEAVRRAYCDASGKTFREMFLTFYNVADLADARGNPWLADWLRKEADWLFGDEDA